MVEKVSFAQLFVKMSCWYFLLARVSRLVPLGPSLLAKEPCSKNEWNRVMRVNYYGETLQQYI